MKGNWLLLTIYKLPECFTCITVFQVPIEPLINGFSFENIEFHVLTFRNFIYTTCNYIRSSTKVRFGDLINLPHFQVGFSTC